MAVRPEKQSGTEGEERLAAATEIGDRLLDNVSSVLRGKRDEIKLVLAALACHGHVLFEDVPGTGKTVLARAIAAQHRGRRLRARPVHPRPPAVGRHRDRHLQPEVAGLRVPARPAVRERRARRRDQPRDAEDAVGPARGDGGAAGDDRRADVRRCRGRSSCSRPRTRSSSRASSRSPRPSSTASSCRRGSATRARRTSSRSSSTSRTATRSIGCGPCWSRRRARPAWRRPLEAVYVDDARPPLDDQARPRDARARRGGDRRLRPRKPRARASLTRLGAPPRRGPTRPPRTCERCSRPCSGTGSSSRRRFIAESRGRSAGRARSTDIYRRCVELAPSPISPLAHEVDARRAELPARARAGGQSARPSAACALPGAGSAPASPARARTGPATTRA